MAYYEQSYKKFSLEFRPDSSSRLYYKQRSTAYSQQNYRLSSRPQVSGQFQRQYAYTWVNPNWRPQSVYRSWQSSRPVADYRDPFTSVSGSSQSSCRSSSQSSLSSGSGSDYRSPSRSVSRSSQSSIWSTSSSSHSLGSSPRRSEETIYEERKWSVSQCRSQSHSRMTSDHNASTPAPTFNDIPEFPDLWGTFMNAEMLDQMDAWRKEAASHFVPPATKSPARRDSDTGAGHGRKRKAEEMGDLDLTVAPPTKVHVHRHHPRFRHSRW